MTHWLVKKAPKRNQSKAVVPSDDTPTTLGLSREGDDDPHNVDADDEPVDHDSAVSPGRDSR